MKIAVGSGATCMALPAARPDSIRKLRRVSGVWSSSRRACGRRIGYVGQRTGRGCEICCFCQWSAYRCLWNCEWGYILRSECVQMDVIEKCDKNAILNPCIFQAVRQLLPITKIIVIFRFKAIINLFYPNILNYRIASFVRGIPSVTSA